VADTPDPVTELGELLRDCGARVYFDRGNDGTKPCTFCGTRPEPGGCHQTLRIGTYPNGDPLRRPVCSQCLPVVASRAAAAPPPKLPDNVCPDCRLPSCPEGDQWDEGSHCPKSLRQSRRRERDCLRIGLDKARANEERMRGLLRTAGDALDAAIAAHGDS
jgi:hypothetical protein